MVAGAAEHMVQLRPLGERLDDVGVGDEARVARLDDEAEVLGAERLPDAVLVLVDLRGGGAWCEDRRLSRADATLGTPI